MRDESHLRQIAIPTLAEVSGATAIALDFETASPSAGSICSIGLAWIVAGRVARVAHRLVRPHDMRFSPGFIAIHGIEPRDVEDEPEFPAIWDELAPHLAATPLLLAHNAPFDIGVLRAALRHYGLAAPGFGFLCTVKIARAAWPEMENHKLATVAAHLGLDLRHHAADSDAAACANIALLAAQGAALPDMLPRWGISPGRLEGGYYEACSSARDRQASFRRHRPPPWLRGGL